MVKETQCAAQKHCSFIHVRVTQLIHSHTHAYTLSTVPSSTSHTSKLDQHALGGLNIAEEVHCGLPLCEVVRDVIKTLGVINPSHSQTQHQNTTRVSQPRDRTNRNLLSHLFLLDDAKLPYHILPVCVAVTEFTSSQCGALEKKDIKYYSSACYIVSVLRINSQ